MDEVARSFCVVAAVNDRDYLARCLAASPDLVENQLPLTTIEGATSASTAYNKGLAETEADIVVFAHQDVYFPKGWFQRLGAEIDRIEAHDPDWAVCGVIGMTPESGPVGRVWSSGLRRELVFPMTEPQVILSVDELVIVLRRASGVTFDSGLPGWHLYGTDIVVAASREGRKSYVIDAPVVHNSKPTPSLSGGYEVCYNYLSRKYRDMLPIRTLICAIERSKRSLRVAQFQIWRAGRKRKPQPILDSKAVAAQLGYE